MQAPELSFQQVKTRRVFEHICEQIRHRLASGALKPGDKLPAERDLALEFKVSRPAVREALRTLEISGVVSLQKGVKGGAFIRDGNPALLTQTLQDLILLGRVSLQNLAEARALINGMVVTLACKRGTDAHFQAIEANIEQIEATHDLSARADAGVRFFGLIARATENEVLVMLVDSLSEIIRYVIDKTGRVARPELVPVRRRILKGMRARDAKVAMRGMDDYLGMLHRDILNLPVVELPRPATIALAAGAVQPRATKARARA